MENRIGIYACDGDCRATVPASVTYDADTDSFTLLWECHRCVDRWEEKGISLSFLDKMMPVWVEHTGYGVALLSSPRVS